MKGRCVYWVACLCGGAATNAAPSFTPAQERRMGKRYFPSLDDTWRLVQVGVPEGIGPTVDGEVCYVFQRKGGDRPTDVFSTHVVPIATFWGR